MPEYRQLDEEDRKNVLVSLMRDAEIGLLRAEVDLAQAEAATEGDTSQGAEAKRDEKKAAVVIQEQAVEAALGKLDEIDPRFRDPTAPLAPLADE